MIYYEDGKSRFLRLELIERKYTARHRGERDSHTSAGRRYYRNQLDRMVRRSTKNLVVSGLEEYLEEGRLNEEERKEDLALMAEMEPDWDDWSWWQDVKMGSDDFDFGDSEWEEDRLRLADPPSLLDSWWDDR